MRILAKICTLGLFLFANHIKAESEGLTKRTIQAVVNAKQDEVRTCYEVASSKLPTLSGKFRVEIKVGKTGKVESTKVKDSTLPNGELESCLENHMKRWIFPAPLASQPSNFSYPFSFGSEGAGSKSSNTPLPGSPQTANDSQVYRGRVFKKSNRPIEDPKVFQLMANNSAIKVKGENCENTRVLKERCEDADEKDRIVCSSMIESAPKKPSTPDWVMIDHPDAFRIVSGVYFLGYWHVACEHVQKLP